MSLKNGPHKQLCKCVVSQMQLEQYGDGSFRKWSLIKRNTTCQYLCCFKHTVRLGGYSQDFCLLTNISIATNVHGKRLFEILLFRDIKTTIDFCDFAKLRTRGLQGFFRNNPMPNKLFEEFSLCGGFLL